MSGLWNHECHSTERIVAIMYLFVGIMSVSMAFQPTDFFTVGEFFTYGGVVIPTVCFHWYSLECYSINGSTN